LAFSTSILNLRKAGLKIPSAYVYEKIGMNAPKDSDDLVGYGLPMTPAAPPQGEPDGDEEDKPKPGKKPAAKAA
jgi:hypothetical protein